MPSNPEDAAFPPAAKPNPVLVTQPIVHPCTTAVGTYNVFMAPDITPDKINLKRDEKLEIIFKDGHVGVYPLAYLRSMCPCAMCRGVRDGTPHLALQPSEPRKLSLSILPGNYAQAITVKHAELVGNYALRIDWSDEHGAGIYSFAYLREICPLK